MSIVDHLVMLLLALVLPVAGAWTYRRYVRRIEAGQPPDRLSQYRQTQILEWSLFAVLLAAWLALGRPFAQLGLSAPRGAGFAAGAALLSVLLAWLVFAWRQARHADAAARDKVVASLGHLRYFLPDSRGTLRSFVALSVTAGIVEEIVYRGFAFWYLAHCLPGWAVVAVAALVFGLGHSYQGAANMLRVTLGGVAFGAYYLLTGSIWLPIVAHALVDILQGAMLYEYLSATSGTDYHRREPAINSGEETH